MAKSGYAKQEDGCTTTKMLVDGSSVEESDELKFLDPKAASVMSVGYMDERVRLYNDDFAC